MPPLKYIAKLATILAPWAGTVALTIFGTIWTITFVIPCYLPQCTVFTGFVKQNEVGLYLALIASLIFWGGTVLHFEPPALIQRIFKQWEKTRKLHNFINGMTDNEKALVEPFLKPNTRVVPIRNHKMAAQALVAAGIHLS